MLSVIILNVVAPMQFLLSSDVSSGEYNKYFYALNQFYSKLVRLSLSKPNIWGRGWSLLEWGQS